MVKKSKIDCTQCDGKGKKRYPGRKKPEDCTYCGGSGKVEVWQ